MTVTYFTRAAFVTDLPNITLQNGDIVTAGNCAYERKTGATATSDLASFIPAGRRASPLHWGADPATGIDSTSACQSVIDWVRTDYDLTLNAFSRRCDFSDAIWTVTNLDATNIRQPGFPMEFGENGGF